MHFSLLNLWSALGIGVVIAAMASVRTVKTKALLYVLPIPISIGLIATHGVVTASNLLGLMLIWVFLFVCWQLADKHRMHIIIADIIAALLYIFLGYWLVRWVDWPFPAVVALFVTLWGLLVWWMRGHPTREKPAKPSAIPPVVKGTAASVISFGIFSLKDLLAGIVVTFPYNGVFAVIEVRHHLEVFIRSVIRNTLAIAALFIAMYYFGAHVPEVVNFVVGWVAFGITLWVVQRISV